MNRLLTPKFEEAIKDYPLYSQDGKERNAVCVAIFTIGNIRWFVLEGGKEGDDTILYCIVVGLGEDEYGYVSLVIIRYNLLASIKRSMDYDTIGGLFADIYEGVHELTVVEKIWDIIFEVIAVVAEILEADSEKLLTEVINNNKRLEALRLFAQAA